MFFTIGHLSLTLNFGGGGRLKSERKQKKKRREGRSSKRK